MKLFLSLISISILAVSGLCQTTAVKSDICTQETIEKISSRGIKLGTDIDETLKAFSESGNLTVAHLEANENGENKLITVELPLQQVLTNLQNDSKQKFGFSSITLAPKDKTRFEGISRYDLGFLDSKLSFFRVSYSKPKWENQEQFIRTISGTFGLPIKENLLNQQPYSVKCGEYEVSFHVFLNDSSMWVDANTNGKFMERSAKAATEQREKDMKAFKP